MADDEPAAASKTDADIQFHTELVSDIWVELLFMHRCSESPAGGVAHVGAQPAFRVPIGRCYTASERLR